MNRFFVEGADWQEGVALRGDEAHHCVRVMRKQAGDEVVVFDGHGSEGVAVIREASKSEVILALKSSRETPRPLPEIEIAVGVPKGKSFELILQKAVEMGVSRVCPLMSAQGNVRFDEREGRAKQAKWQRLVVEACKQCGQNHLPEVALPLSVEDYLAGLGGSEAGRFVGALLPEVRPFRESLGALDNPKQITLMIGPEGDFSEAEYQAILGAGFAGVGLGDLILRTETAVFWMVAAVRYQFQR